MRPMLVFGLLIAAGTTVIAADPVPKDGPLAARVQVVDAKVAAEVESLVEIYKDFHAHPELSLKEERSSARLAKEAKDRIQ